MISAPVMTWPARGWAARLDGGVALFHGKILPDGPGRFMLRCNGD